MGGIKKIKCEGCGTLNSPKLENCQNCGLTLKFVKSNGLIVGMSGREIEEYNQRVEEIRKQFKSKDLIPKNYGRKTQFETEDEYNERHLGYDYIQIGSFVINEKSYDTNYGAFKIEISMTIEGILEKRAEEKQEICEEFKNDYYNFFAIDRKLAEELYNDETSWKIYQKYHKGKVSSDKAKITIYGDWFVAFKKKLYIIESNKGEILKKCREPKEDAFEDIGTFEIHMEDYNYDKKQFKIYTKVQITKLKSYYIEDEDKYLLYAYIDISEKNAKSLFDDTLNRQVYQIFGQDTERKYYINLDNQLYEIKYPIEVENELVRKREEYENKNKNNYWTKLFKR